MSLKLNTENCAKAFEQLAHAAAGNDPEWLAQRRARAMDSFRASGLPSVRDEQWKYTDIRPLTRHEYHIEGFGESLDRQSADADFPTVQGLEAYRLVLVNGRLNAHLSDLEGLPEGAFAGSLASAIATDADVVRPWLGRALPADGHGFSALNDAFVNDGAMVRINDGVQLERPIEIVFVCTGGDTAPLVQPRNLVRVGEGACATIIERYVGTETGAYLTNVVTEVFLDPSAKLEFCRIQQEGSRAGQIGGLFVRQRAESECVLNTISLDGMMIRNDLRIFLDEPGARCTLHGLALGTERSHIDNHTTVEHVVERCISREFYKSVLDDRARAVFHGRIIVHRDAQKTDSEQHNHNLLLSSDAEVDTKPQLEIYADDVKCSHGATVGQLDEDSVFYLRTRGIDETAARALLTIAFAESATSGISSDALRAHIDHRIRIKLNQPA